MSDDDQPKITRIEDSTIEAEGTDADEVVGFDATSATFVRNTKISAVGRNAKRVIGMRSVVSSDDPPSCVCGARIGVTNSPTCPSCGRPLIR